MRRVTRIILCLLMLSIFGAVQAMDLDLEQGWNLISPDGYASVSANQFSTTHAGVFTLRGGEMRQTDAAESLTPWTGYWLQTANSQTVHAEEESANGFDACTLEAGWNLLSSINAMTPVQLSSTIDSTRPALQLDRMLGWENGQWLAYGERGNLHTLQSLQSGHGYWLHLSATGVEDSCGSTTLLSADQHFTLETATVATTAGAHSLSVNLLDGTDISSVQLLDSDSQELLNLTAENSWSGENTFSEAENGLHSYHAVAHNSQNEIVDRINFSIAVGIGIEAEENAAESPQSSRLLSFNLTEASSLQAFDQRMDEATISGRRLNRKLPRRSGSTNLVAVKDDGEIEPAIESDYGVHVSYTAIDPSAHYLYVVIDIEQSAELVKAENCAIFRVSTSDNSNSCVKQGVYLQSDLSQFHRTLGNDRKPVQFDGAGNAYFAAQNFVVEGEAGSASLRYGLGDNPLVYRHQLDNNQTTAITNDAQQVNFFLVLAQGELIYQGTNGLTAESKMWLYKDGSSVSIGDELPEFFSTDDYRTAFWGQYDNWEDGEQSQQGYRLNLVRSRQQGGVLKAFVLLDQLPDSTFVSDDGNLYGINQNYDRTQVTVRSLLPHNSTPVADITFNRVSRRTVPIRISGGSLYYTDQQEVQYYGDISAIKIVDLTNGSTQQLLLDDLDNHRYDIYAWQLSGRDLYFSGVDLATTTLISGVIDTNKVGLGLPASDFLQIHSTTSAIDAANEINDIEILLPKRPVSDPGGAPELERMEFSEDNGDVFTLQFSKYMEYDTVESGLQLTSELGDEVVELLPLWFYRTVHLIPDRDGFGDQQRTTPLDAYGLYQLSLSQQQVEDYYGNGMVEADAEDAQRNWSIHQLPVAISNSVIVDEDQSIEITLEGHGVTEGSTLLYSIDTQPAHGVLTQLDSDRHYRYTPNEEYNGSDQFSFSFSENSGEGESLQSVESNSATISLEVTPVADLPRPVVIPRQSYPVGSTVWLNATRSIHPDGLEISGYQWSLHSSPDQSELSITDPTIARTAVTLDQAGEYRFQITVTDSNGSEGVSEVVISASNDHFEVAAGNASSAAINSEGQLLSWGEGYYNLHGETTEDLLQPVVTLESIRHVAIGREHTLAVKRDGTLWGWGRNGNGQLGDETTESRTTPIQIMEGVRKVEAGHYNSFAIKSDGTLWGWGQNQSGQLGDGTTTQQTTPQQILDQVVDIATGESFTLALREDGSLWSWGYGQHGQLGNGESGQQLEPIEILTGVQAIAAGQNHAMALDQRQRLWSWGYNREGQLGDGTTTSRNRPVEIMSQISAISAGYNHSVVIDQNGALWGWGDNSSDVISASVEGHITEPLQLSDQQGEDELLPLSAVSAAENHTLLLDRRGRVYAWGGNGSGQLGHGNLTTATQPQQVIAISGFGALQINLDDSDGDGLPDSWEQAHFDAIDTTTATEDPDSDNFTNLQEYQFGLDPLQSDPPLTAAPFSRLIATTERFGSLTDQGQLLEWGSNQYGYLGDGTTIGRNLPQTVLTDVEQFSFANHHQLVLKTDGTLWSWGRNNRGQLGIDSTEDSHQPNQILEGVSKAIATNEYSLALKSDGTLWGWGFNSYGQLGDGTTNQRNLPEPILPQSEVRFRDIFGGSNRSYALDRNHTLWSWGYNSNGELGNGNNVNQSTPVAVLQGVRTLSIGATHTVALRMDGTVWSWGDNSYGVLGDGTSTRRYRPVRVLDGVVAIAAGSYHTLALRQDGTIWGWGYNSYGNLGQGDTDHRYRPLQILDGVAQIAASGYASFALKSDHTLWGWGYNSNGEQGSATTENQLEPRMVLAEVERFSYSGTSVLLQRQDGTLWSWGRNSSGELGQASFITQLEPQPLLDSDGLGLFNLKDGDEDEDGLPDQWERSHFSAIEEISGSEDSDEDGISNTLEQQWGLDPGEVDSVPQQQLNRLALGHDHTALLRSDGTLWTLGYNGYGQLGDGTTTNQPLPQQVLTGVKEVATGSSHTVALKQDGTLWGWGRNNYGQLGNETTTDSSLPLQILHPQGLRWNSVVAGGANTLAISEDYRLWGWGYNGYGQLGDGSTSQKELPVEIMSGVVELVAGGNHTLALRMDGTLWGWGYNGYGQLGDSTTDQRTIPVRLPLQQVTSIYADKHTSFALKGDHTLWGWGRNDGGQLGIDTNTSEVTPVLSAEDVQSLSVGADMATHIKTDGTVWSTGLNQEGQLGNGSDQPRRRWVQVASEIPGVVRSASGERTTLIEAGDGLLWGWGRNDNGQLGELTTTDHSTPVMMLDGDGMGYFELDQSDEDGDGLPDRWEQRHYLSTTTYSGDDDIDGDGLPLALEMQLGLKNPYQQPESWEAGARPNPHATVEVMIEGSKQDFTQVELFTLNPQRQSTDALRIADYRVGVGDSLSFSLTGVELGENSVLEWDFGEALGQYSTATVTNIVFAEAGRYPLTLTITTSGESGETVTTRQRVVEVVERGETVLPTQFQLQWQHAPQSLPVVELFVQGTRPERSPAIVEVTTP